MKTVPTPSIPDLARAEGEDVNQLISWFLDYYDRDRVPWNYVTGVRTIKEAYRGFSKLSQLFAACAEEKNLIGRKSNEEIVECAAPIAFGRNLQVFDLPRQRFQFGLNLFSAYRIPFFFLEEGVVKLYFVQPRKGFCLTFDQLCMVATIHKRFLLDQEFFGQPSELEYVDLSAPAGATDRDVRFFTLADLSLWSSTRLNARLELIAGALDYIDAHDLVKLRRRPIIRDNPDLPLFD